tara:strand:+ start:1894 stop:2295 length:402 start_codon:yes stop_codon:yes gene_type:complete
MGPNKMYFKKLSIDYNKIISLNLNFVPNKSKLGLIYTLYSDRFNLLEVGFAENNKILETKLLKKEFILLDKKIGKAEHLNLLIKTLKELNFEFSSELSYKYSNILMKHLSTLGWPVGKSLYKQRKIKKEISYA